MNHGECHGENEALRVESTAGIFRTTATEQLEAKLKTAEYTDLAHRTTVCVQENGHEEACAVYANQLFTARVVSVDVKKKTVNLKLHFPTILVREYYDDEITLEAKVVAFRCTVNPKSPLLCRDVLEQMSKTDGYMTYDDIVAAIETQTKPFDRDYTPDYAKGERKGTWTSVRGFVHEFCEGHGLILLNNQNIKNIGAVMSGMMGLSFTARTRENCLFPVHILDIKPRILTVQKHTSYRGCVRVKSEEGAVYGLSEENGIENFIFKVRDTTWNKPEGHAATARAPRSDKKKKKVHVDPTAACFTTTTQLNTEDCMEKYRPVWTQPHHIRFSFIPPRPPG